jgi:formylglycine-generating enzyme required for sulfatase activity
MAQVLAGEFLMGATDAGEDAQPQHLVYLDEFYIDVFEVTNSLYDRCVQAGACIQPYKFDSQSRPSYYRDPQYAHYPVINVDWKQAHAFCKWRGARLPTEAEWEKASRGGLEGKAFPWGNDPPSCQKAAVNGANFDGGAACVGDTQQVGSYAPNGYGLYDMAGNVWERVSDYYSETYYSLSPDMNPIGPETSIYRGFRGGSWATNARWLFSAVRGHTYGQVWNSDTGFRCARSP